MPRGKPLSPNPSPGVIFSLRLTAEDKERLTAAAATEGVSASELARSVLLGWLDDHSPTKEER